MNIFRDNSNRIGQRTAFSSRESRERIGSRVQKERISRESVEEALSEYNRKRESILLERQRTRSNPDAPLSEREAAGGTPTYREMLAQQQGVRTEDARVERNPLVEFRKNRENRIEADKKFSEKFLQQPAEKKSEAEKTLLEVIGKESRLAIPRFLFGSGTETELTGNTFGEETKAGGAVGFLYQTILKSEDEIKAERYDKLVAGGTPPERAFEVANSWQEGDELPITITEDEESAMKGYSRWRAAFIGLELADLLLLGKPVNTALKTMARGSKHAMFQSLSAAENAAQARSILREVYPHLADKEGAEEVIKIARESNKNDSWRKVLQQNKRVQELVESTKEQRRVRSATEAQRVFYENGIPIVRGGDVPATTISRAGRQTPDFTADAVALRTQINDVLAGTKESARLSNLEVFADEVRAGAIPFKNQVDDQVEFFVSGEVKPGRLRPGDRLASSKEVMEEVSEAGKARVEKVLPKDLVRLDDGTFVYAPADQVGKGVQGTLRSLRQSQRSRVQAIEQSQEMSRIEREANQQAQAARNKEIAKQQAAERAKAVAQAQRLVDNAPARKQQELTRLRTAREEKINEIKDTAKQSGEKISSDSVQRRIAATRAQFNQAIQEQRRLFDERLAEAERLTSSESRRKATKRAAQAKKRADDFNAETTKAFKEAREKATEEANLTEQYGTLRPVKGDGKVVVDQVVQGLQDKINAARKAVGIDETAKGSSATKDKIEQLPFLHRVATNEEQLKIAVKKVATDPAAAYRELIQGSDESTVAHLAFALLDSKYIADDVNRLSMLIRKVDEVATASGQQLQAFNIFNKHDYTTIVRTLMRQGEEMMTIKKIDKAEEVRKIEEALGKRFDELATASKQGLLDEFGEIVCK